MTYEELFLEIDLLQNSLPKCALPVLLRLIAKCIEAGTNVLTISARDLAAELGLSRDAVKVAARALSNVLTVEAGHGECSRWTLPGEWFYQQRSLFATKAAVQNRPNWPGNQATTGLETRPRWTSYQATSGRVTRPPVDELPGHLDELPGHLAWKPGHPGLVTRPPSTQNQQLTDDNAVRSDQSVGVFTRDSTDRFNQIIGTEVLKSDDYEDARVLSEHLRAYMAEFGPKDRDQEDLGEVVLARCLACAPLGDLLSLLRTLRTKGTAAGKSYAWFVAVFAHRLCRIDSKQLRAGLAQHYRRKQAQRETESSFFPQLLHQANSNVRHMR